MDSAKLLVGPSRLLLVTLLVATWIGAPEAQATLNNPENRTGKSSCRFRSGDYSPGEIWYPSPSTNSPAIPISGHCVRCACLVNGRLNCTKEPCPTNCPQPGEQTNNAHPCCKYCPKDADQQASNSGDDSRFLGIGGGSGSGSINQLNSPKLNLGMSNGNGNGLGRNSNGNRNSSPFAMLRGMLDSGEEMDEDDEDGLGGENSEFVSCFHQGNIYRDGDIFTTNITGLPIASPDQCMQCQCQGGMVLCAMKMCSIFKCSGQPFMLTTRSTSTFASTSTISNHDRSTTTDTASSDGSSSGTVIGPTCCQRCAASQAKNPKSVPQKPPEERVSVMRRPTMPGPNGNGPQRIGYTSSFANTRSPNSNSQRGQGMSSGTSTTNFISRQQVESSVSFRDGSAGNTIVKGNGGPDNNLVKQLPEDCISAGRFYMHDSTWHPVIGPLGPMECVLCKCNDGQIECNRLKCPHKRELSCSKPIKVEGHCCPICTTERDQIVVPEGSLMCVSAKQDLSAYKSQGIGSNGTEFIEFAFLKPTKTSNTDIQVELHEWTLNNGDISAFTTDYLSVAQFDTLRNRQSFVLLGATNEKNVEKFTRREKKLERRCTSRCSMRIISLERSLRLHRVIARAQCLFHERVITT